MARSRKVVVLACLVVLGLILWRGDARSTGRKRGVQPVVQVDKAAVAADSLRSPELEASKSKREAEEEAGIQSGPGVGAPREARSGPTVEFIALEHLGVVGAESGLLCTTGAWTVLEPDGDSRAFQDSLDGRYCLLRCSGLIWICKTIEPCLRRVLEYEAKVRVPTKIIVVASLAVGLGGNFRIIVAPKDGALPIYRSGAPERNWDRRGRAVPIGYVEFEGDLLDGQPVADVDSVALRPENKLTNLHSGYPYYVVVEDRDAAVTGDRIEWEVCEFFSPATVQLAGARNVGVMVNLVGSGARGGTVWARHQESGRTFRLGGMARGTLWRNTDVMDDGCYDIFGIGSGWISELAIFAFCVEAGKPNIDVVELLPSDGVATRIHVGGLADGEGTGSVWRASPGAFSQFARSLFSRSAQDGGGELPVIHGQGGEISIFYLEKRIEIAVSRDADGSSKALSVEPGAAETLIFDSPQSRLCVPLRDFLRNYVKGHPQPERYVVNRRVEGPLFGEGWVPLFTINTRYSTPFADFRWRAAWRNGEAFLVQSDTGLLPDTLVEAR